MEQQLVSLTDERKRLQRSLEALEIERQTAETEAAKHVQDQLEALQEQVEHWRQECEAAREEADAARMVQQPRSGSSTSSEWELLQAENEKLRRQVEMILQSREDNSSQGRSADELRRQASSQNLEALTLAGVTVPPMSVSIVPDAVPVGIDISHDLDDPIASNAAKVCQPFKRCFASFDFRSCRLE